MNTNPKMAIGEGSRLVSAEQRLKELGMKLPAPPEPFGAYAEAVQTGNLLFLTGMLPTEGRVAKFIGRVGAELDVETGRKAAHLAALNAMAVAREHLGSLRKRRALYGLACRWPLREMSASCRNSRTAPRSCCKTSSEKTRTLAAWFTALRASRWYTGRAGSHFRGGVEARRKLCRQAI